MRKCKGVKKRRYIKAGQEKIELVEDQEEGKKRWVRRKEQRRK